MGMGPVYGRFRWSWGGYSGNCERLEQRYQRIVYMSSHFSLSALLSTSDSCLSLICSSLPTFRREFRTAPVILYLTVTLCPSWLV